MSAPAAFPDLTRTGEPAAAAWLGPFARLAVLLIGAVVLSSLALAAILAATGMALSIEFARFVLLAAAMLALGGYCRWRRMHWTAPTSAVVVALVAISLLLCGLVSSTGLRLGLPLTDEPLFRTDALFGIDVRRTVHFVASQPTLAAFLHLAYNASGPLCLVAVVASLARRDRIGLWRTVATIGVAMHLTGLISVLFPTRGAIVAYGLGVLQGNGLPFGAGTYSAREFAYFYSGQDTLVSLANLNGIVCFPSFHTVMALVILQGFVTTRLKWPAVLWSAVTIVSTVPMGGHYVIDLIGGVAVWTSACLLADWACRPLARVAHSGPASAPAALPAPGPALTAA